MGVGLDINTGKAIRAVQHNLPIRYHPDTGRDLLELKVPNWELILSLSSSCYEMSGLGYIGTDMVLDKFKGPMLLELNARPGLAIQTANGAGLVPRLRKVEKLGRYATFTPEERVIFARREFAADVQLSMKADPPMTEDS